MTMGWLAWVQGEDGSLLEHVARHAALDVEAAAELLALVTPGANVAARSRRIAELAQQADLVSHACVAALQRAVKPPIGRSKVHALIRQMNDVADAIEAAAGRVALYELDEVTADGRGLAELVFSATKVMGSAVAELRELRQPEVALLLADELRQIHRQAAGLQRVATSRLLQRDDVVLLMKWKEIHALLAAATRSGARVADTIEAIVIEHR
jgi:uncharacterized protein Yka (UPF0111/DUF47 family)